MDVSWMYICEVKFLHRGSERLGRRSCHSHFPLRDEETDDGWMSRQRLQFLEWCESRSRKISVTEKII